MEISTQRLVIRSFETSDLDDFAAIVADPEVMRYLGGVMTRAHTEHYLTRAMSIEKAAGFSRYAVSLRDGELIGMCGFAPVEDYIDLGYRLARRFWGQGYASEAAARIVTLGFDAFDFEQITGLAHPDNAGSINVLTKLGFQYQRDETTPRGLPAKRYQLNRSDSS